MQSDTSRNYQIVVEKTLTHIYHYIEEKIMEATETDVLDERIPAHAHLIANIQAFEAEWILDDDVREKLSILGEDDE